MFASKSKRRRIDADEEENDEQDEVSKDIKHLKGCVYFYAEVNNNNILKMISCLHEANDFVMTSSTQPLQDAKVVLYINSGGGDAFAGLSGMDHIRTNRVPVTTIADGYVASAATLLLLGGSERASLRNSRILIHQLSTGFWGKYVDLLDEVENSKELMAAFQQIYSSNTNIRSKKLKSLLKKEINMTASQALEYGFVTRLI